MDPSGLVLLRCMLIPCIESGILRLLEVGEGYYERACVSKRNAKKIDNQHHCF